MDFLVVPIKHYRYNVNTHQYEITLIFFATCCIYFNLNNFSCDSLSETHYESDEYFYRVLEYFVDYKRDRKYNL